MRSYLHVMIAHLLIGTSALVADPFPQDIQSEKYKVALRKAQAPVDVPASLARPLPEIKLEQIPFADVIDGLRDLTEANFVVNYHALERAGMDRATPITFAGGHVSSADILDAIVEPFADRGVLYRVSKEAVYISTEDDITALRQFEKRNEVALANGPLNPRLVVKHLDGERWNPPVVRLEGIRLVQAVEQLARQSAVDVRVDREALGRAGIDVDAPVFLSLRNPLLGDALAAALWVTGRIDDLDLRVDGNVITVTAREKPAK